MVSTAAEACPQCGFPTGRSSTESFKSPTHFPIDKFVTTKRPAKGVSFNSGCLTFVAASIIGLAVIGFFLKISEDVRYNAMTPEERAAFDAREKQEATERAKRSEEKNAEDNQKRKDLALLEMGKDAVKARLKDPGSARFSDVYVHRGKDDIPTACGTVNSKNGFGGYTGEQRFISNGLSAFLEGEVSDFDSAWAQFCTD